MTDNRGVGSEEEMVTAAGAAAVAALIALLAYGHWPYGYYQVFRWIISGGATVAGYSLRSRPVALIASAAVALAFNPIAPMRIPAYEWRIYDISAAITMILVSLYAWRLRSYVRDSKHDSS